MSILIKGMEAPKDCLNCRFHKGIYCVLTDICTNASQGCPLIEIPTPHGRLIDASKIPYKKIMLVGDDFYYGTTLPYIERMPTIIEAEEGEHGEEKR